MAFRTGLITLLFGIVVAVLLLSDRPLRLASRHSQAIFTLIILSYACSLLYAALFRGIRHKERFFAVQVGVDVVLVSSLVHLTGGVHSVYSFLFPLLIVEATIVFYSQGALRATVAVTLMFVLVTVGGWVQYIPPIMDQPILPSKATEQELAQSLILNLGGQICIAVLAAFLADQLRSADQRVAEQRRTIRDMVRHNENVLQSLQTGLLTMNQQGHIMSANRAAARLLGHTENQLAAASLHEVLPGIETDEQEAQQRFRTLVAPPTRTDSPTPLEVRVTPLWDRDHHRSGSLLLLEDLTEISSMEDRVKRAERLAALGRLAAGVAHEIRNPLASVSGSLELLQAAPDAPEEDRQLIGIAVREVDRLATLVTNLLEYARPRPLMRMELNLLELAQEVASACAQDPVFSGIDVVVNGPKGGCIVDVDTSQIRQVLWNLYRNAAEVNSDGAIEVEVGRKADDPGFVYVSVTDHGPGIPAENRDHIFEPFFTTKDAGTGLGLSIVHRIIEDHEGTIEVDSPLQDGQGTRITIYVPDYVPETTPLPSNPSEDPVPK